MFAPWFSFLHMTSRLCVCHCWPLCLSQTEECRGIPSCHSSPIVLFTICFRHRASPPSLPPSLPPRSLPSLPVPPLLLPTFCFFETLFTRVTCNASCSGCELRGEQGDLGPGMMEGSLPQFIHTCYPRCYDTKLVENGLSSPLSTRTDGGEGEATMQYALHFPPSTNTNTD